MTFIQQLSEPYASISYAHLRSAAEMMLGSAESAYKHALDAANTFFSHVATEKGVNWWLPAVDAVVLQLRLSACKADGLEHSSCSAGEEPKYLSEMRTWLNGRFGELIVDRSEIQVSKKLGCLSLALHLFKVNFKLNSVQLSLFLTRTVEGSLAPLFDYFPMSQLVTYYYYSGRIAIFQEQYAKAEQVLDRAFALCPNSSLRNKRRVLGYLIPCKLLVGRYPQPQLLQKLNLPQFQDITTAIRQGNLKLFNSAMDKYQDFFIRKGIYLLLEKLQMTVHRNLVRKVFKYNVKSGSAKPEQIPLKTIEAAYRVYGVQKDTDEIECLLANLIFRGEIKGFVMQGRGLGLSRQDPFPRPQQS